jgi:hypothetical protein
MPKTIDYPRTTYLSAWEIAEVVDDTGGKCAIETCARKLSRKVSGSFKAIIGSAVKFGLVTSKRELLTTTNLFRRIKHAYDKQEEKVFHREAFLHPPLFTQICRKFRNRELPVHMLDVMLIREFGVEEINAQNVAKAFIDGARMVDILDERNIIADIDQLAAQQTPRRELSSTEMPVNLFKPGTPDPTGDSISSPGAVASEVQPARAAAVSPTVAAPLRGADAVSSLFGLDTEDLEATASAETGTLPAPSTASGNTLLSDEAYSVTPSYTPPSAPVLRPVPLMPLSPALPPAAPPEAEGAPAGPKSYSIHISGPGIDSHLLLQDTDDLAIVSILLEKIRKRLTANEGK